MECVCPIGYSGNPYVACRDIDECVESPCGSNSICINTPGSFDCKCLPGHFGNPFAMCSTVSNYCDDPHRCVCGPRNACPTGYRCDGGKCSDLCDGVSCGPRAACALGQCVCPLGYIGDANDHSKGCHLRGQCEIDQDCRGNEICFQTGKGVRSCVDACGKFQCGPNALCVSSNHRSSCICQGGFSGNPTDFSLGCQPQERGNVPQKCEGNTDCRLGEVCMVGSDGIRDCINPCVNVGCGANEVCQLDANSNPSCHCKESYVWNPLSSACEKPSIPDCTRDEDCHQVATCQPDALGILKCQSICDKYQCPINSVCVASSHQGECQCLPGFVGNPKDRNGCQLERRNQCTSTAECSESDKCKVVGAAGVRECRPACEDVVCGPQAICVSNNHNAKCQCPPGPYDGDPYNVTSGCQSVPCVYNIDCPPTQLCNRLTHTCYNVCDESSCGENAICIAENQAAVCQCPPGYRGDPIPEAGCKPVQSDACAHCAESAICELTATGHICKCPAGYTGFPESTGCHPIGQCLSDGECPTSAQCVGGRCVDKCHELCGPNMLCAIKNGEAVCACPSKFRFVSNFAKDGCVRDSHACATDFDCDLGICNGGQCTVACRNQNDCADGEFCQGNKCVIKCSSHSQCPGGQACRQGICTIGCRSNKDCGLNEACYNNNCQNPCEKNACGPNALCKLDNQLTVCHCPAGFEGNPTPEQGCVRIPSACTATNQCPNGHMCIGNQCNVPCSDSISCAIGERCDNNMCAKVCYTSNNCLPGEICNERGTCESGCSSEADCPPTQVCINAKCKCGRGFIGTPFGCSDIDECSESPCHQSALCENTPGSFRCACPAQTVGDPYSAPGCLLPDQCARNEDCANNLACFEGKCTDACHIAECGRNAVCEGNDHKALCHCPAGHLGDPTDKPIGCFRVECVTSDDCSVDKHCNPAINKCQSEYKNIPISS